jgi:UDP-N-acetyl-D-galactosamine dehydrogenase
MGVDTEAVLHAAETKWNFARFRPGLVGGHCIGVDPYYLTYESERLGYTPHVILAGRQINDEMGRFIADRTVKEIVARGHDVRGSTVSILGLTFKENVPDLRNSRLADIVAELRSFGIKIQAHDPFADTDEALEEIGVEIQPIETFKPAQAVILAVAHRQYKEMGASSLKRLLVPCGVLIDVKCVFPREELEKEEIYYWRL